MLDRIKSFRAVADYVGLSRPCVIKLHQAGDFPQGYRLTGAPNGAWFWDRKEIDKWLMARKAAGGK